MSGCTESKGLEGEAYEDDRLQHQLELNEDVGGNNQQQQKHTNLKVIMFVNVRRTECRKTNIYNQSLHHGAATPDDDNKHKSKIESSKSKGEILCLISPTYFTLVSPTSTITAPTRMILLDC